MQSAEVGGDPSIGISGRSPRRGGMQRAARGARWLLAAGAVLLLAACSSLRFGYNNADTLLLYTLDSYFDLDDGQEALARERVRGLLAWHRSTQLAAYAGLLDSAGRKLDGELTPADVLALNSELNARLAVIGAQAATDLARLALTLQPPQIEHFAGKLAESNAKARRSIVGLGGVLTPEDRTKRWLERAQDWLGPLSETQVELVRQAVARRPGGGEAWVAERARRQQDLLAILTRIQRDQPAVDTGAQWLRAYFADLAEPGSAERRARAAEFRAANADLIAQLVNSATPQQRAHAAKKLRGYAADFTVLAAEGGRG